MELLLPQTSDKATIFEEVNGYLTGLGLATKSIDDQRPWGGFFVIDESQASQFISRFFPTLPREQIEQYGDKLSPKILVVEPHKKLSWQYHHRRAELWRVVAGTVGIITSNDDAQTGVQEFTAEQTIQFGALTRHRLVGLDEWGVVAEIWQHTDPENPSDEDDIVRIEDDFGR